MTARRMTSAAVGLAAFDLGALYGGGMFIRSLFGRHQNPSERQTLWTGGELSPVRCRYAARSRREGGHDRCCRRAGDSLVQRPLGASRPRRIECKISKGSARRLDALLPFAFAPRGSGGLPVEQSTNVNIRHHPSTSASTSVSTFVNIDVNRTSTRAP